MIKVRRLFALLAAVTVVASLAAQAHAQVDNETFRVVVPSRLSISAPAPLVSITHDETDNDQFFGAQQWTVMANSRLGATATFETNQVFTHTVDSTYKRNVKLDLTKASGSATWLVTAPTDTTNYAASDEIATVTAASTQPGAANFDLTVTFIEETFADLADGNYEMTVTGTLTAN